MADVPRTAAIQAAVTRQLNNRRALLDRADDLGEVVITVRLHAGTDVIKSVVVSEQYINRRNEIRAIASAALLP